MSSKTIRLAAVALSLSFAGGDAIAQDKPDARIDDAFSAAFGIRYWFSTGQTSKDLYDTTGTVLVSRLTYDGLNTHSGEIFGNVSAHRLFLKGHAGLGAIVDGSLQDEDFPPVVVPYSSTDSDQEDGDLAYATIDLGGHLLKGERGHLGGFVGYNFLHQEVNAFGCEQTATALFCVPAIDSSVAVITQDNDWHSFRVGMNADVMLGERVSVSAEGAYLPFVVLDGADSHHLRIGCGRLIVSPAQFQRTAKAGAINSRECSSSRSTTE
jgi:hypothetical protein